MTFATEINFVSHNTYVAYLVGLTVSGIVLLVIAAFGFGTSLTPRVFCAVFGVVFLSYGVYVAFIRPKEGVFAMYPVGFTFPILALGYVLYSRMTNRELDAEISAEMAAKRAAKAAAADQNSSAAVTPSTVTPSDVTPSDVTPSDVTRSDDQDLA